MQHFYKNIQGWSDGCIDIYKQIVDLSDNNSHFVEVGSWKGQSSAFMAVEIINSGKKITFDCVDHFKGSKEEIHQNDENIKNLQEIFLQNMQPVNGFYNCINMDSIEAAKLYNNESLDFVFLDGSHDYDSIKNDIFAWYPKIKKNGILAGDDYFVFPDVKKAVNEVFWDKHVLTNDITWLVIK